jgi:hypothetical protein
MRYPFVKGQLPWGETRPAKLLAFLAAAAVLTPNVLALSAPVTRVVMLWCRARIVR